MVQIAIGDKATHWHIVEYDEQEQKFSTMQQMASEKASWLRRSSRSGAVYTVSEASGRNGTVSKFVKVDSASDWRAVWTVESSSEGPCHVDIVTALGEGDQGKEYIAVANYVGHTCDLHDADTGRLLDTIYYSGSGPHARQATSHCHQIRQCRETGWIYVCDLGGDKVHRYKLTTTPDGARVVEDAVHTGATGSGPRHLTFHKPGRRTLPLVYLLNELNNTLSILESDDEGMRLIPTSQVQDKVHSIHDVSLNDVQHEKYPQPPSSAEICITDDGRWLYGSIRYVSHAHAADPVFYAPLDPHTGQLSAELTFFDTGLIAPWDIATQGDLVCVAFRESRVVRMYRRDGSTGALTYLAEYKNENLVKPCCVLFL